MAIFSHLTTKKTNKQCVLHTRLDRGRRETEVLFTEQSSMTIPYGNVCLLACLSFSLSVCLKPWLLIHQRFSPPACTSAHSHASLGSEFPFSLPFPSINLSYFTHLLCPPRLSQQPEKCHDTTAQKDIRKLFLFKNQRILIQMLYLQKHTSVNELYLSR